MAEIAIDLGYSSTKVIADGKMYKFPTAVSYASSSGLDYGDSKFYEFEGDKYTVGVPSETSFTTTDYKFLSKFAPLIIFHVLKMISVSPTDKIEISTGLAISDWSKRQEFAERISNFQVNDTNVSLTITSIMPQGAGCFYDYAHDESKAKESTVLVVDGGYNTVNTIYFQEGGVPVRDKAAAHVGQGASTIIKEFTKWLELRYNLPFAEQEALKIFMKRRFVYNGIEQEDVVAKIDELKKQFVNQLFKSILVSERKLMATTDIVLMAGGLVYFLKDTPFPPNVRFVSEPYEFSNVRGYAYAAGYLG